MHVRLNHAIVFGAVGLALAAVPGNSQAATLTVKVFSLKDVLASKDPDADIQRALRNNRIKVTVTDVTGPVPVPLITNMEINPDTQAITYSDEAVVVRVEFTCPGLRTAVLDGVHNINQAVSIVMPKDTTYILPPTYAECPPECIREVCPRFGFLRRRK